MNRSRIAGLAVLALAGIAAASCSSGGGGGERTSKSVGALTLAPTLDTFALYGQRSITLRKNDLVLGGGVGVTSVSVDVGAQLRVGDSAFIDPTQVIFSPSVLLGTGDTVGLVATYAIDVGTGSSDQGTAPFPLSNMPAAPLARAYPLGVPGLPSAGPNVTVSQGQVTTLAPGAYGALVVEGTVDLDAGNYTFTNVVVAAGGSVYTTLRTCTPETICSTNVQVAGTLFVGAGGTVSTYTPTGCGIDEECLTPASELNIFVSGNDTSTVAAATFLGNSNVDALVSVPEGTLFLGDSVSAIGAFAAFDVVAGQDVSVSYDSGFPATSPVGAQQLSGYYGFLPTSSPLLAPVAGPVPADAIINLDIGLPTSESERMKAQFNAVSDPLSPSYRQYITQDEFAAEYGASVTDYDAVKAWATNHGFNIYLTFTNRLLLSVDARADQIEHALYANLVLRKRRDGTSFLTVDREPSIDLATTVLNIRGLTDLLPMESLNTQGTNNGTFANTSGFSALDLRQAYLQGPTVPGPGGAPITLPSTCLGLTGQGQVVGIFSYNPETNGDIQKYDALEDFTGNILPENLISGFGAGGGTNDVGSSETAMDVDMVQAMAPAAAIQIVSETPTGSIFNYGHVDAAYWSLATNNPPLTVATFSWIMGRDQSEQNALYAMALEGVSTFAASGDYGAIDDPQNFLDMDAMTIVGGTYLSTAGATVNSNGSVSYPPGYYQTEDVWNATIWPPFPQCGGISGGGVMNGTQDSAGREEQPWYAGQCFASRQCVLGTVGCPPDVYACQCWPPPLCCGSPVPIPLYQANLPSAATSGNNRSAYYRNYPDVAMVAANLGTYDTGSGGPFTNGGTSGASPLWAGFMALANELSESERHNAKTVGFANPVLYGIGTTMGSSLDLYKKTFHDVKDGLTNGLGGQPPIAGQAPQGYPAVPGYDLATGWGSPSCGLIHQLADLHPYTALTPNYELDLRITTGHDDFSKYSEGTATIVFGNGNVAQLTGAQALKPQETEWQRGAVVPITLFLPDYICQTPSTCGPDDLPTGPQGIESITINLIESTGEGAYEDNWDIDGLDARLYEYPGSSSDGEWCAFDLGGSPAFGAHELQDNHVGIARLSATQGNSGIGPQVTFARSGTPSESFLVGTNCNAATGSPVPIAPAEIQFILGTGSHALGKGSGLYAELWQEGALTPMSTITLKAPNTPTWNNDTLNDLIFSLGEPVPDYIKFRLHQSGFNDYWNCNGIDILVWSADGAEQCFNSTTPSSWNDDSPVLQLKGTPEKIGQSGCP